MKSYATAVSFALYGLLLLGNIPRRSEFRDRDTMNFVDVAAHIAAGDGVVQSTVGFNEPHLLWDGASPAPLTVQAPLYPILAAAPIALGLPPSHGALAISALAYALVLWLGFAIARTTFDLRAGLCTTALLLLYLPLNDLAKTTYSDVCGLALCLACVAIIVRMLESARNAAWLAAAAGALAGCAFATRYALLPLTAVGLIGIWLSTRSARKCVLYVVSASVPIALVFAHNYRHLGSPLPTAPASTHGLALNTLHVLHAISARYLANRLRAVQIAMLVVAIVGALWLRRRQLPQLTRTLFQHRGAAFLALWSASYLVFLIVQRSLSHFDSLDRRLVLPGSVPLMILAGCALTLEAKPSRNQLWWAMMLLLGFRIGKELNTTLRVPRFSEQTFLAESERLRWLRDHTSSSSVVVGDDLVDVPFYLHHPQAFSFSPHPYTDLIDYSDVLALCPHTRSEPLFISLSERVKDPTQRIDDYGTLDADVDTTLEAFGPFIAALDQHRLDEYPRVQLAAHTQDGDVFTLDCQGITH